MYNEINKIPFLGWIIHIFYNNISKKGRVEENELKMPYQKKKIQYVM